MSRYELRNGKYGPYHHDTEKQEDICLLTLTRLLNELDHLKKELTYTKDENQCLYSMVSYYNKKNPIDGVFKLPAGRTVDPSTVKPYYNLTVVPPKKG